MSHCNGGATNFFSALVSNIILHNFHCFCTVVSVFGGKFLYSPHSFWIYVWAPSATAGQLFVDRLTLL